MLNLVLNPEFLKPLLGNVQRHGTVEPRYKEVGYNKTLL